MIDTVVSAFRAPDIRRKLLFTLGILLVFRALTNVHESHRNAPWPVEDAPADYIDGMLRAIVGIEVLPTSIVAKRKLSQNQPVANAEGVRAMLAAGTAKDQATARAMPVR